MQHHWLNWDELKSQFPKDGEFKDGMRPAQETGLRFVGEKGSCVLELPTGLGKTAMEVAIARAAKTKFKADEIPCSMLRDCPHRVDQETGKTHEDGAIPCPYLQQKYEARNSRKPVLATLAFYLYSRLFSKDFPEPDVLIIDEAHRVPETIRSALSYDITDWHLEQAVQVLENVDDRDSAAVLAHFRDRMIAIVKRKSTRRSTLLDTKEIVELTGVLDTVDSDAVKRSVTRAIRNGALDAEDKIEVLRKIESVVWNLRRYIRSLELSLPLGNRGALSYTYAYHVEELGEHNRVEHKLVICSHYIAALVQKCLLGKTTIALSATIGDNVIYGQESGIKLPFLSVPPSFPAEHTRIFMPTDTPNLAYNERKRGTVTNVMRRIVRSAKKLAKQKIRSLHVVVSNEERQKLLALMEEEGVKAVSYGNGVTAREAALRFKDGEGDCLVGTAGNFGEGVDLPRQIAPVIFGLRPAYPPPDDPRTQFEERRYGNNRWAIWNWRVMLSVLQWRGRNIRSEDDLGVTIFISQQFRRSVFAALPKTLQSSYKGDLTLDQCVKEAMELVG